jgi:D-alanyl-lipoteichoic acid acyltransferase DltB (MBOAT superfamily)
MALLVAPWSFYLTFAGFFQMIQSLGRVAGVPVPDSFNRAFGRENIAAFWANWNMTATRVFRDYLFYARWGSSRHHAFLNTLILFTLVGLWHDTHPYWILWGFLHGILFCAYMLWRRIAPRPRGTWAGLLVARAITYVSVCACWYLPSKILQGLGW